MYTNSGVKETAESMGIKAERVDEQIFHKENILERIYNQIDAADFIISDMTSRNPNVFYETGYAHAKGKLCLLLTSNADDIPFDLKHHRHIIYGNSIQNLRQSLESEFAWIKAEVANKESIITLDLVKSEGLLEKSEWIAKGKVDLHFDLNNKTTVPSPELEAIYFYTGKGWKYQQDGQDCLSTKSDIADYDYRHFIKPPVRRLQSGAWAQVKISGEKTLETRFRKGEILKDKYRVSGRALVRIATSDGNFDFPVQLDVTIEEFPF
jgi:nucleoside 2-deoxyribosyltransferase